MPHHRAPLLLPLQMICASSSPASTTLGVSKTPCWRQSLDQLCQPPGLQGLCEPRCGGSPEEAAEGRGVVATEPMFGGEREQPTGSWKRLRVREAEPSKAQSFDSKRKLLFPVRQNFWETIFQCCLITWLQEGGQVTAREGQRLCPSRHCWSDSIKSSGYSRNTHHDFQRSS